MQWIGQRNGKNVWFDAQARPYRIVAPVAGKQFVCALFVADPAISDNERMRLSSEIVAAGCRYALCAGLNCAAWDDSIDFAHLETDPNFDPPDETFVMTTWHENESVAEVLEFALNSTDFDGNGFEHLLVLMLGDDPRLRSDLAAALGAPSGLT